MVTQNSRVNRTGSKPVNKFFYVNPGETAVVSVIDGSLVAGRVGYFQNKGIGMAECIVRLKEGSKSSVPGRVWIPGHRIDSIQFLADMNPEDIINCNEQTGDNKH